MQKNQHVKNQDRGPEQPYVFNHAHGTLTVFAQDPKDAMRRMAKMAQGTRMIPAFEVEQHA